MKKLLKQLIALILLILIPNIALSDSVFRAFDALTGAGNNAMEDVDGDNLAAGHWAPTVTQSGEGYMHYFVVSGSCGTNDSPNIIYPLSCSGDTVKGYWKLITSFSLYPTATPGVSLYDSDATDGDRSARIYTNCIDAATTTEDCELYIQLQIDGTEDTTVFRVDCDATGNCDIDLLPQGTGIVDINSDIRLPNTKTIYHRNAADDGDVTTLYVDASDQIIIGDDASANYVIVESNYGLYVYNEDPATTSQDKYFAVGNDADDRLRIRADIDGSGFLEGLHFTTIATGSAADKGYMTFTVDEAANPQLAIHDDGIATYMLNTVPQSKTYTSDDEDQTTGSDITSSIVLVTGDNNTDNSSIDLQDGTRSGLILTFVAVALVDADDTVTIDIETDTTPTAIVSNPVLNAVGDSVTLIWTGSTYGWIVQAKTEG